MSLGSQLQTVLKEFHAALPEDSPVLADVDRDVTHLRRMSVDGVAVLDDAAFVILGRLYGVEQEEVQEHYRRGAKK